MSAYLTVAETIKECRAEAKKKHGLTFKTMGGVKFNGRPAYKYVRRGSGEVLRSNLTLGSAYKIACSGELVNYDLSVEFVD